MMFTIILVLLITYYCFITSADLQQVLYRNVTELEQDLPNVLILPIDPSFYVKQEKMERENPKKKFESHEHGLKYFTWLKYHYDKTVDRTDAMKYREMFYFVPALRADANAHNLPPIQWWIELNSEIMRLMNRFSSKGTPLILDQTFMALSTPWGTDKLHNINSNQRNVNDLRFLRVDGEMSVNGREIMVPYIVNRNEFQVDQTELTKRKYFIAAVCAEAKNGNDGLRGWRSALYRRWHDVPDSAVLDNRTSHLEFDSLLKNSDFCAVIPGDTSATSKLYKTIFAGCIPVIFVSSPSKLPFVNVLNWKSFAIIAYKDEIKSDRAMDKLAAIMSNIRSNSTLLAQYKRNVNEVASLLDYSKLDFPSVYHLTLLQLVYERKMYSNVLKAW